MRTDGRPMSLHKLCMCLMLVAGGIIWICYGNSERLWYFSVGAVLLSYPVGLFFNSMFETVEEAAMRETRRKIVQTARKSAKNEENDNDQ